MTLELIAALLGALAVFVTAGALTGSRVGGSRRRVLDRALRLEGRRLHQEAAAAGDTVRASLIREDLVARNRTLAAFLSRFSWVQRRAITLDRGHTPLKVSEYVLLLLLAALALSGAVIVLTGFLPAVLPTAALAFFAGEWLIKRRAAQRIERFSAQLPAALQMMATSLQSGFGIMEGMMNVSREMDPPLSEDFQRILDEVRLGGAFDESLQRLADRIGTVDMQIVTQALAVHRSVGGNLGEILEQAAATAREREEIRRHLKSLTAQERMSANIIAALTAVAVGILYAMAPELITPLWTETVGRSALATAVALEITGFLLMRRVMKIEV